MKNFEFKSQVATSIEQSKRLLELGLKKETADMWHIAQIKDWRGNDIPKRYQKWWLSLDGIGVGVGFDQFERIPAWSLYRLIEMMPPSIKDGYHYSLIYDIHRDAIEYICFANGGMQRPYNRLLWDTQSTDAFENIIVCFEWLIKEGCFNKDYLEEKHNWNSNNKFNCDGYNLATMKIKELEENNESKS